MSVLKLIILTALCLLFVAEELRSSHVVERVWTPFEANMARVFRESYSEIQTRSASICVAYTSGIPSANVACFKSSRCVGLHVLLSRVYGSQTENFTCWRTMLCNHDGQWVREHDTVPHFDPVCNETRPLKCGTLGNIRGMFYADVPMPRTTCSAPFMWYKFGCMNYPNLQGSAKHCDARRSCQEIGAELASPRTAQGVADMKAYFSANATEKTNFHIGLRQDLNSWKWPINFRDPGPAISGDWDIGEPSGDGPVALLIFNSVLGEYNIGDSNTDAFALPLCHAWDAY